MIVVISTQYMENYGAHDWDGKGACPQYWKFKGGSEYKVMGVPVGTELQTVLEAVSSEIESDNDYCREYILDVRCESDDYLSEFERSQLEYDGEIQFPEPKIDWARVVDKVAV